jgi:flavodoxin I
MTKVRLFYGSTTGNTERVAGLIKTEMGDLIESVTSIADAAAQDLSSAEGLILGVSTWDDGQLQPDWDDFFPRLDAVALDGKTVALFGLGDAQGFSGQFVDALGKLYAKVRERGARVVGPWPVDGYEFDASEAVVNGEFVGLVIDEDNDPELTQARVKDWVQIIRPAFSAG